jgi:hypothetical protein
MKIIAKINHGFLVEATENELALILGFRSSYDDDYKKLKMNIGVEIEVGKINSTAEFVRNMDQNKLKNIRQYLTNAMNEVDKTVEMVEQLNLFDKLKKEEPTNEE